MEGDMSLHEQFGSFRGKVIAEWDHDHHRKMILLSAFSFEDPAGKIWQVPAGAKIDGASSPWWLWSIVGSPYVGRFRPASVVHDYFCYSETESWKDVHKLFFQACRANGVNRYKARIMFWAVYVFGPRWPDDERWGYRLLTTFYKALFPRRARLG
jgi:hypothetical protein